MPMYEYRCTKCGYEFEEIRTMTESNPLCPHPHGRPEDRCGAETEKLISKSSFTLKGGGWSSDGYGK